jgi:CheY-like chemotaxis protein
LALRQAARVFALERFGTRLLLHCTRAAQGNRYDMVLMDVQTPVVDGVTATLEILSYAPADHPHVISGLTAH